MRLRARAQVVLGCAMVFIGVLLLLSAWRIPYAVEVALAAVFLYPALVVAGVLRGHRAGSAVLLMVVAAAALMLPSNDPAWGLLDHALQAGVGLLLVALGFARAVDPGPRQDPRAVFYGEGR